jgi:hypothetical protein
MWSLGRSLSLICPWMICANYSPDLLETGLVPRKMGSLEPKTTVVQNQRSMSTWVLRRTG